MSLRPAILSYGVAVVSVLAAALVRLALDDLLQDRVLFATFFVAVFFTVWYGGLGPSLLCLALGTLAAAFFVRPVGGPGIEGVEGWVSLLLFLFVGGVAIWLNESLRLARLRAEAGAAEAAGQRERLHTTLASIGDAVLVTDDHGRVTLLNGVAETLTGWSAAEAWGRPLEEVFVIINEQTGQPAENPVARVLREGVVVGLGNHTVLVDRSGRRQLIDDSAAPVRDEQGNVLGAVLVFRDVSVRRRDEHVAEFLAGASLALASLVDYQRTLEKVARLAVPFFADWCAVDMVEPDGSLRRLAVAHANPERLWLAHELQQRYPPAEDSPHGVRAVLRTGQPEMVPDITDAMLVAGARDEQHLCLLRALGLRSYLCVPLAIRGKVLGVLTFVTAESGRRFTEADRSLAEDLAYRAAVAVENSRLYGELRASDRRKDEFLAMLAHELRNPLAPIQNALHILERGEEDREAFDFARAVIGRQVQHLVRLVDDLLDISRIMRGRVELRREQIELSAVVARAVETARPAIDAQRHQLTVALPGEPVRLDADPVRLAQVLANLLLNSAKYTPEGGSIRLSGSLTGAAPGEVVLRVRDTGIGIPPEMLPHIFDLFTQVDSSPGRSQGGLGIGLTLVRRLVELHGGRVEAFSKGPGQGSEFTIRLPILDLQFAIEERGDGPHRQSQIQNPTCRRVLIVDDNVDAANSLALMLRLQGHEVLVVHEGPAALEAATEFGPDVGVLDLGMPGMDGYELARRLRRLPGLESVLLIALTGWGQEEFRRRSKEAGFDHHLVKPADPRSLHELLVRHAPLSN
ncbi:MAG: response regulator [Planctomycetes bacterium]|nr:response regulator [Planctomycetota bacterium]